MHQARTPRKPRLRYEQTKSPSYARIHRITRSSSSRSFMSMALPMASPALPWPLLHGRASTTTSTHASQRVHNRSDEESFFSRRRCSLPTGFPFQASGSIGRLFPFETELLTRGGGSSWRKARITGDAHDVASTRVGMRVRDAEGSVEGSGRRERKDARVREESSPCQSVQGNEERETRHQQETTEAKAG